MWLECTSKIPSGRVHAQGDGIDVLVGCVEGIGQLHQEGVTAPALAVLDEGAREPSMM